MNLPATDQLELWKSSFGADYTDRNDVAKPERISAWRRMVGGLQLERVLEVGCNVGWNLSYLSVIDDFKLFGVEPQSYAVQRARAERPEACIVQGDAFDLPFRSGYFDLAFTCGVLIHIHQRDLHAALDEMFRVSRRYLLYVEYDAPTEELVPYRGTSQSLWKRDHRAAWQKRFPQLSVVRAGELGADDGFDDCGWAVFEK